MIPKSTICWKCKKASGGCSWSRDFVPVDGWDAKEKTMQRIGLTYLVKYCPEFEEDKTEYHANDELITAICKSIVRDYKYLMVYRIKQPDREDVKDKLENLNIGILADIYSEGVIKKIFKDLKKDVELDIEIMDAWIECKNDDEKEKIRAKYGENKVKSVVRHYAIHPLYMGRKRNKEN